MGEGGIVVAHRRAPLRRNLVMLLLVMVALVCVLVGSITHASMNEQLTRQVDDQLSRAAVRAGDNLTRIGFPLQIIPGSGQDELASPRFAAGQAEFTLVARAVDGHVTECIWIDRSGGRRILTLSQVSPLATATPGDAPVSVSLPIGDYRVMAQSLPDGSSLVTGLPLAPIQRSLARLDITLLLVSALALIVIGVVGTVVIRRTLRPLEEVSLLASRVADARLDEGDVELNSRVPDEWAQPGTEVGDVGRALNRMLDNVENALTVRQRSEEKMRRFVGDASHELRTPLTAIRGYTDMLRLTERLSDQGAQALSRVDTQSRRMTALVEDLLLLARLDEGRAPRLEPIDLGEILVENACDIQVSGQDHVWKLAVPDDPVMVLGDASQLAQVVMNLLSNARKHTPAGTLVSSSLGISDDGRSAVLRVVDNGPGIDPDFLGTVFDRFSRADKARSGLEGTSGLGLSIVEAIVRAHNGTIEVTSKPGDTVFEVRLPLADLVDNGEVPGEGA
ncbi:sensor histidine kinase [Devriesea agamarum]|uniref:sensor histidine kinase n=1 Tax=Devriesea agamarum TaxID=472569 RepID=UPI00071E162C|nr:HAMP domain-containing sensor histidine kinase [Devriesea agamarum]